MERGERLLVMGLNGAGKTSLLRILADETGRTPAPTGSVSAARLLRTGARGHPRRPVGAQHMHQASRADDQALRTLLGMFGLHGEMAFQDAGTLSAARRRSSPSPSSSPAGRTCCSWTSRRTTSTPVADGDRARPRLAGAMVIVSHDTEFVGALAPNGSLMMPEGGGDHWTDDLLDLVALA